MHAGGNDSAEKQPEKMGAATDGESRPDSDLKKEKDPVDEGAAGQTEKSSETTTKRPVLKDDEPSADKGDDNKDNDEISAPAFKKAKAGEESSSNILDEAADETHKPVTFPVKLMALLQQEDPPEGIYWLPSGDIFAMHTEKMDDVLVKHFQGTKFMVG
jgi:hypothetical protein